MSNLSRRQLLVFFGAGTAAALLEPVASNQLLGGAGVATAQSVPLSFTPVRLPHPLPIYQQRPSFLPTDINQQGSILPPSNNVQLTSYTVQDDVVVPPEYERYIIARWGDRLFPNPEDYFGYNADYTGFVPIGSGADEGYLWVNHEYVSYPMSSVSPGQGAGLANTPTTDLAVLGFSLPTGASVSALSPSDRRFLMGEFYYNQGGSILRISRRNPQRRYTVVRDAKNRRIHGLSGLGINAGRTDGYQSVTAWGSHSYQQGDNNYLVSTGPAATEVFNLSSDGLGNKIIGTAYNCSGGTTPWGTILSAEENFQGSSLFFMGVQEGVLPNGTQTSYISGTSGAEFGLVGEKYGWLTEIDPANPNFRPRKHTALGRFRHENIAMRVEPGKKLVAYMGDDRRGGHTWKYVSTNQVVTPTDKANSSLFAKGKLYVAQFNANGTGRWILLSLNSPVNPATPSVLGAIELAALGSVSRGGNTRLPKRDGIAGQVGDGGSLVVTVTGAGALTEAQVIDSYKTKAGTKAAGQCLPVRLLHQSGSHSLRCFPGSQSSGGHPHRSSRRHRGQSP
ncbi:PhoX family protein [Neosynechococcus sphagnicola]|uniref:PhoX family protein n=1 Tax=Neosynechococcus sphagnicola TaxID=1501145 RepID=UPI000AAD7501|nr:alkaline phosphatase PhoX [Neosynechococcus sphagnicola]